VQAVTGWTRVDRDRALMAGCDACCSSRSRPM
jgi:hypothetical protein